MYMFQNFNHILIYEFKTSLSHNQPRQGTHPNETCITSTHDNTRFTTNMTTKAINSNTCLVNYDIDYFTPKTLHASYYPSRGASGTPLVFGFAGFLPEKH